MPPDDTEKPRTQVGRAIAILAVLALIAGVGLAFGPWTRRGPARPAGGGAPADTGEAAVTHALQHARSPDDSLSRWVAEVPGVDLLALDTRERRVFVRHANAERCTCGCGFTLAACRVYDDSCEVSGPRVAALFDSVRSGWIRSAEGLRDEP
jgi:hypothetical protein